MKRYKPLENREWIDPFLQLRQGKKWIRMQNQEYSEYWLLKNSKIRVIPILWYLRDKYSYPFNYHDSTLVTSWDNRNEKRKENIIIRREILLISKGHWIQLWQNEIIIQVEYLGTIAHHLWECSCSNRDQSRNWIGEGRDEGRENLKRERDQRWNQDGDLLESIRMVVDVEGAEDATEKIIRCVANTGMLKTRISLIRQGFSIEHVFISMRGSLHQRKIQLVTDSIIECCHSPIDYREHSSSTETVANRSPSNQSRSTLLPMSWNRNYVIENQVEGRD